MQKELCDKCGKEITTIERWQIGLRFVSSWIPNGDTRLITLCGKCGWKAARLLGFAFDTGKILSCARKEYVTDATVCGANGGGMLDIAFNGVGRATHVGVQTGQPDAPLAGAMQIEEA